MLSRRGPLGLLNEEMLRAMRGALKERWPRADLHWRLVPVLDSMGPPMVLVTATLDGYQTHVECTLPMYETPREVFANVFWCLEQQESRHIEAVVLEAARS